MGKYSDFERVPRDWYPTPEKAFLPLAPLVYEGRYIEPCAGDGTLIRHMVKHTKARLVVASDIAPQNDTIIETDLFFYDDRWKPDFFITNPPWLNDGKSDYQLNRIIMHLSDIAPTWLLLDGNFLFNKKSQEAMERCRYVLPIGRVKWIADSKYTGKENVGWYLFDKNSYCNTQLLGRR